MTAFLLSENKDMQYLPWKLFSGSLLIGLAFDVLIFHAPEFGLNVLLFELVFFGVSAGLSYHLKHKFEIRTWVAIIFSLLYAGTFAFWTSAIGLALSGFGLVIANSFFILFLLGHHNDFKHPFEVLVAHFKHTFLGAINRIDIIQHLKLPGFSSRSEAVGRGILITIPILIIFALLFVQADIVLQQQTASLLNSIRKFFEKENIVGHMIGTIFVSTIMLAIFGSAFWRKLDLKPVRELAPKFKIEATIIFSTVSALFLTFLIIQSFYLFGGKNAWDNIEGITYSEYAVNGFGELAVISILVISLILSLRYLHTEVTKKIINILEAVLVVETVLVVASAWTRLNLYVSEYGFTPARLFGFWFFITVSITLLLLLVNILRQANQADFMRQATVFIGVSMLIFTVSAPDAFSVRLNINRATTEKPMDIFPLFDSLTAEAYPLMNLVINTKTVPIKGLIEPQPAIEDYCGYFHDRRSRDDAYVIDAETRIDIERWNVRWNNYNYERLRGEKGTAELKTRNFKTWNLSRATIPYAKYSFIDVLATTPYSYTELKAVCDGAK